MQFSIQDAYRPNKAWIQLLFIGLDTHFVHGLRQFASARLVKTCRIHTETRRHDVKSIYYCSQCTGRLIRAFKAASCSERVIQLSHRNDSRRSTQRISYQFTIATIYARFGKTPDGSLFPSDD